MNTIIMVGLISEALIVIGSIFHGFTKLIGGVNKISVSVNDVQRSLSHLSEVQEELSVTLAVLQDRDSRIIEYLKELELHSRELSLEIDDIYNKLKMTRRQCRLSRPVKFED